jgi:hypothetical protein
MTTFSIAKMVAFFGVSGFLLFTQMVTAVWSIVSTNLLLSGGSVGPKVSKNCITNIDYGFKNGPGVVSHNKK